MRDFGLIAAGIAAGFIAAITLLARDEEDKMTERLSKDLTQAVRQATYLAHQEGK